MLIKISLIFPKTLYNQITNNNKIKIIKQYLISHKILLIHIERILKIKLNSTFNNITNVKMVKI